MQGLIVTLVAGLSLGSCSPASAPPPVVTPPAQVPLHIGPLEDYLPSVGLRWLVQLRPEKTIEDPALKEALARLLPAARLQAYVRLTGADPREIAEAWFGEYELGSLWLFDASRVGLTVEQSLRNRAWSASAPLPAPEGVSHWTYVADEQPSAFLRLDEHLVAVAERDPKLATIVRAYGENKLKRSAPALVSVHLAPLARLDDHAAVRLFALGPFERGVLAEQEDDLAAGIAALSAGLDVRGQELWVSAHALGAWDDSGVALAGRWTERLARALETPELRAIGGSELESALDARCAPLETSDARTSGLELCDVTARFSLTRVLDRLRWLTAGTLGAIANEPQQAPTGTPVPAAPSGSD